MGTHELRVKHIFPLRDGALAPELAIVRSKDPDFLVAAFYVSDFLLS